MNNKGNIISIALLLVTIIGMAITLPLIYRVYSTGVETLQNMSGTVEQVTNETLGDFNTAMSGGLLDQAFLVLFAMITIAMLIMAFVSDNALPFLVFYIIISIVFVLISIPMSNVYQELMASPQFAMIPAGAFTMTVSIMNNLPMIITVVSIIVCIVLFARVRSESGGTYY